MIVLDASVLIAHLDSTDVHHERARSLLLDVVEEQLVASHLTLAEVLVGPARTGRLERAASALRRLAVTAIPFDDDDPPRLAAMRADSGLRLPDCCVLLVAQKTRSRLATFDQQLARAARERGHAVLG